MASPASCVTRKPGSASPRLSASASPGVISPVTGLVKNANSIALNGHAFDRDISALLDREVRVENDANCFALSEATDGAGAGHGVVFGVILGTGCGGGVVVDGKVLRGRNHVTGEWGHNPLPWPRPDELPGPHCWCGHCGLPGDLGRRAIAGARLRRRGCARRLRHSGPRRRRRRSGAGGARSPCRPAGARPGAVINLLDPDVIVLGGGLSNMDHLYTALPPLVRRYVFSDFVQTPIVRNKHGDSSGVRGAAWLWPADG